MQTNLRKLIPNLERKARFLEPVHCHLSTYIDVFHDVATQNVQDVFVEEKRPRNLFSLHQQYKKIHGSPAWMQFRNERSPYERAERPFSGGSAIFLINPGPL